MQLRHEVTQCRQRLIAKCQTTRMISQICVTRAFIIVPLSGQQMGDHTQQSLEHCSAQQTSHPAATVNRYRRNCLNTDGSTKSRSLSFAGECHDTGSSARTLQHGPSGSWPVPMMELCITGAMFVLSTVGLETTITESQRQTRPQQTTMTTQLPSPATVCVFATIKPLVVPAFPEGAVCFRFSDVSGKLEARRSLRRPRSVPDMLTLGLSALLSSASSSL